MSLVLFCISSVNRALKMKTSEIFEVFRQQQKFKISRTNIKCQNGKILGKPYASRGGERRVESL